MLVFCQWLYAGTRTIINEDPIGLENDTNRCKEEAGAERCAVHEPLEASIATYKLVVYDESDEPTNK